MSAAAALARMPALVMRRSFAAPRVLVFRAFTRPEHLARWWGPHGHATLMCELDPTAGGAIRMLMRAPGGKIAALSGRFEEVDAPARLAFTLAFEDEAAGAIVMSRTTVTLEERAGFTTLTLEAQVLEASSAAGPCLACMESGWSESLERLQASVVWN